MNTKQKLSIPEEQKIFNSLKGLNELSQIVVMSALFEKLDDYNKDLFMKLIKQ